jgi:NAD(P)-dependent dehydrogenase (short-subunit alcohol dehydrogenase family)
MSAILDKQIALVTGASRGIGRAIAIDLAKHGATVIGTATSDAGAAAISEYLKTVRADAGRGVVLNVNDAVASAALIDEISKDMGGVSILVNNAGITQDQLAMRMKDEEWDAVIATNLSAVGRLSRAVLPGMKQRDRGRIVFISSESGICPPAEMVHYGMTKSAQLSISRGIAETCAGTGVTVNSVLPGPTTSRAVGGFLNAVAKKQGVTPEEIGAGFLKSNKPTSLLHRFATPEEVANMIVYVCSPQASATTGAAMLVEGGVVGTTL